MKYCFSCDKLTGNLKIDTPICARCREVLKVDLAMIVKDMDPIYLTERNRNKKGRKSRFDADARNDIKNAYKNGETIGQIAARLEVSKSTIWDILHKKN